MAIRAIRITCAAALQWFFITQVAAGIEQKQASHIANNAVAPRLSELDRRH